MSVWNFERYEPPDLSHLHEGDRNRIEAGQYDARESELLRNGQNPWAKSGKPEPLKPTKPSEPTADVKEKKSDQGELPLHTGTRVIGQTADDKTTAQQERDRKLRAFMSDPVRAAYDAADFEQKQIIWAANERAFEAAEERKAQKRQRDLRRMAEAFDAFQRAKEDPDTARDLPPDKASMPDILKWHEDRQKPTDHVPFPVEAHNIPLLLGDNLREPQEIPVRLQDGLNKMGDAVSSPASDPNDKPWHKRGDLVLAVVLALGAAVLGIAVLLLPPKSVNAVIFWLALMFLLLAAAEYLVARYRDWSWFKTIVGIVFMAGVVVGFGWFAWPEPLPDTRPEKTQKEVNEASTVSESAPPKRIRYTIKGENNIDLSGATVKAYNKHSESTFEGYVEKQGEIRIKGLSGGVYAIFISHPKFGKFQGRFVIPIGGTPEELSILGVDATVTLEREPY